jgi:thiol-disulfide isomerase/thioredoxin
MKNFIAAFSAEHIKKKGTGLYITAAIVGAVAPLLFLLISSLVDNPNGQPALPYNHIEDYTGNCLMLFTPFLFPLIIIITVSRVTQLDHKNGGWQLMEMQPLQKFSIYFSKFLVILVANSIVILSLIGFSILCGYVGALIKDVPKVADTSFPWVYIVQLFSRLFVASLFITAFQFVIAVLMPSFIWSMLIGFFFFIITSILKVLEYLPDWYPYEILNRVNSYRSGSDLGYWFTYTDYVSLFAAILLLSIGFQWFKFKRFKAAFFGNSKRFLQAFITLIVLGGLIIYTLIPNLMTPYNKTVIAGEIKSDIPIRQITLFDKMIRDTVAKIAVVDGKFNYEAKNNIPLDRYDIEFDHSFKDELVIGKNDSVYLTVQYFNNVAKTMITGTRLAENQPLKSGIFGNWSRVEFYLKNNEFLDRPEQFAKALYNEWKDRTKEKTGGKTVDNYVPTKDFTDRDKKLLTITYLNYWEQFLEKRRSSMPDEKTGEPKEIKTLKEQLSLTDEGLLSEEGYFKYVSQQLIKKDTSDANIDTKRIAAISKLPRGSFKDKMLFWQLNQSMQVGDANEESKQLIATNGQLFSNQKYTSILTTKFGSLYNLRRGMVAPEFNTITLKGKSFTSDDLKGKYTVIDVWATWCLPCEEQSYYFENLAAKYKNKPIQFVALSVDQKKESWFTKAQSKSKSVLQLHVNDMMKFYADYNLETIPRFILLDDKGNFVNSKMPFPSEKAFEILLRKELKLQDE